MRPVELFHIGPQKSGTTWLYECLREHPEVACPPRDSIHYYDMFYHRGPAWYADHFVAATEDQKLLDPTPSYIRSPRAPSRIAADNPGCRVALCMRNPMERAFSHYWHERKKGRLRFDFSEVLTNYDLFSSWVEPGFYALHIERYLEHIPRERILCQRYDDLRDDPEAFLHEYLVFAGVDPEIRPSMLHQRVNVAGRRRGSFPARLQLRLRGLLSRLPFFAPETLNARWLSGKAEYERGIPPALAPALAEVCEPEIRRLERLLEIDLSGWRDDGRPTAAAGG